MDIIKTKNPDEECLCKLKSIICSLDSSQTQHMLQLSDKVNLLLAGKKLELVFLNQQFNSYSLDYDSPNIKNQIFNARTSKVSQACGVMRKPIIWDMTCGFGLDSLVLAHSGATVFSCEYNPIVGIMVQFAKWRYGLLNNWTVVINESKNYFKGLPQPDVIYIDRMFPKKPKGRLSEKKMQILSYLNEGNDCEDSLLDFALQYNCKIVLKLPKKHNVPEFSSNTIKGKSIKFVIISQ